MSDEEKELLVKMVSNGHNTFAELNAAFPREGAKYATLATLAIGVASMLLTYALSK